MTPRKKTTTKKMPDKKATEEKIVNNEVELKEDTLIGPLDALVKIHFADLIQKMELNNEKLILELMIQALGSDYGKFEVHDFQFRPAGQMDLNIIFHVTGMMHKETEISKPKEEVPKKTTRKRSVSKTKTKAKTKTTRKKKS